MENFWCLYAPWLFAILSGLLGWFLKSWYDRDRQSEYENDLRLRDNQILGLTSQVTSITKEKDEHINRMIVEINKLKANNHDLQNKLANSVVTTEDAPIIPFIPQEEVSSSDITDDQDEAVVELQDNNVDTSAIVEDVMLDDIIRYKKRLKKRKKKIIYLKNELSRLSEINNKLNSKLEVADRPIVKEIPVTITKEVEITQKLDTKKLLKLINKLPVKKSRKVVDKSKKKGKPRIIKD